MSKERNLLWLDLEMTGLNPDVDLILEIACVITDGELNLIAQGPSMVIHHDDEALHVMSKEVEELHAKSGLIDDVRTSTITLQQAEEQTVNFLKQHSQKYSLLLAGNTVWQDRSFLVRYMPHVMEYLHYRIIDVSSIKELVRRWYPQNPHIQFKKAENHRALEDTLASIEELKHYRKYFFING
jgi:oligoribonuclease